MAEFARSFFHASKARRIVEQSGNFPCGSGKIVAANRSAFFQQVVGVTLFLAGNRLDERHGQSTRKRFGRSESSGFADEQIRRGHVLVHLLGEAHRNEARRAGLQITGAGGNVIELFLHLFRFSGDGHDLPRLLQCKEIANELFDRADAISTRSDENDGSDWVEPQLLSSSTLFERDGKERVNGNSGDAENIAWDADSGEIFGGFWNRHVIAVHGAAEPHGVDVVIGDDDGVVRLQFFLGAQPGNDFAGKKMRGDAKVGLDALQHANHRLRVEAVHGEAAAHFFPRLVSALVEEAHQLRRATHHADVRLVIEALKDFADVLNDVNVFDEAIAAGGEGFFEGLRGADVAGSGRCGKKEDARFGIHTSGRSHADLDFAAASFSRMPRASFWISPKRAR